MTQSLRSRVRAMLHGIALGDALGAPVEKLSAAEIRARYGRVSSLDTEWHKMSLDAGARNGRVRGNGIVTDDTLMTLALMDIYGDSKRHLDAWDMADGMVRQIAWTPRWVPELQREAMLIVAVVLDLAKDGTRAAIADIAGIARQLRGTGADHASVCAAFHAAIARYSVMGDDVNHMPEKVGRLTDAYRPSRLMAIEELPLALGFCLFNGGDFRASIEDGINSGRDTDSIGVMAGAILGALHGEAVIAADDRALLDSANRLDLTASADAFTRTATEILAADRAAADVRRATLGALGIA